MANHYSGKRAAGRKPVGKRALSLLMALVMSLSLVQITAFAENDTAADKTQVVEAGGIAYYDKNGMKLEPATGSGEPGNWVVKVERTLKETGKENLLDVDLKVTTKDNTVSTDAEAAAVLVIDTSGSMADCATCGKGENDRNHEGQPVWKCPVGDTTWDPGPWYTCRKCGYSGWDHTLVNVGPNHAYQSRLELAQFAANSFVASFAKNAAGEVAGASRYVAIVAFATTANTKCAWVDVTQGTAAVEAAINGLVADGGTNTEAGLQLASNLLGQKTDVKNRFTVLLTDGLPTFHIDSNKDNKRDGLDKVPSGYGWGLWHDDGVDGPGNDTTKAETAPVETVSKALKADGVKVYGVTYGVTQQIPNGSGDKKDIDEWMTEDCQMAGVHSVKDPNGLNAAFSDIINTIQHETVGTTVVTAVNNEVGEGVLTDLYNFVKFNGDANGAAANNNQVTWDLSKATPEAGTADNEKTYHLSYQVWMGTETQGFEEETPYSLGAATLSFKVNDGESKSVAFPYVAAKGYLGELDFTKVERVDNEFAPLASAEFKLTIAEGSTFGHTRPLEGASNDKGAVAISGIPSGYTYTLSETKAPEGYVQTDKTWTVTVSYGEVTVTEAANPNDPTTGDAIENLVIENTKIPPEKVTITVIHNYYTDAVAGTPDSTETLSVEVEKGSDYTAAKQEKGEYKFVSADPEDCTLRNITEAGTITLNYVKKTEQPPVETEFTATVKYYYSDNGIDGTYTYDATKDATITVKAVALPVTVTITDKADGYTFNGNYTTDGQAVSNLTVQLTENGQEFHVYYYKNASTPTPPPAPSYTYYTVTVNYYDKDSGEVIHTAYTTTQREYTAYDVTAQDKIAITGYTYVETTGDALTGTLNGNKVINVYYTKDSNIDDGNTPTDPGTDIGDDDVPVTPAKPPKTGDSMGLWIAAAMVSGMGLIWLSLSGRKRKEEI